MMVSAVNRRLDDPVLRNALHSSAYQAGTDFLHEWAGRTWSLGGAFAMSLVRGSPEALLATQASPSRYFQRPDAAHLVLNPARTALGGYFAMLKLAKTAGAYQLKIDLAAESPGYEVNDLGYHPRVDRLIIDTNFVYQHTVPGTILRSWTLRAGPDLMWNYEGEPLHSQLVVVGDWQFANYWTGTARIRVGASAMDDRLTRGGPLAEAPASVSGNAGIGTDSRRPYQLSATYVWLRDQEGSWESSLNLNLSYRVRERLEFQLGPRYARSVTSAQYVTVVDDPLADQTSGRRYVFADLEQTTVSLEARVNLTLSPNLSFELFAQPFLSSGSYGDLKELRAPRTFDFLRYGSDIGTVSNEGGGRFLIDPDAGGPSASFAVEDQDFDHRSLLGNAVLRWEWRAGSTLFLVWQQRRSGRLNVWDSYDGDLGVGRLDLGHDSGELFRIRPDNVFLVKITYWLNP
jgi:hypothetical protein